MKVNLQDRPGAANCSLPPRRVVSFLPARQGLALGRAYLASDATLVCPDLAISIGVLAPASAS
jgi:hypothetical protein